MGCKYQKNKEQQITETWDLQLDKLLGTNQKQAIIFW